MPTPTSVLVRRTQANDREAIRTLLNAAFAPSRFESHLSELVMAGDDPSASWVAVADGVVAGFVLYTEATRNGRKVGFHLAPLAVRPDHQQRGIGSKLVRHSLEDHPVATEAVFVLGEPSYYERFGFAPILSARCPYDPENEHFRALRWTETDEPFVIGYAPAFRKAEALYPAIPS